ncbi:uncharacterized protein METZ01_LOCUS94854 [marine metagenome]|uniref:Uncharacterized protein n=1 Tax=marine metagenome TaxID=408172 RepID=A0A381VNW2_9ZZZZ
MMGLRRMYVRVNVHKSLVEFLPPPEPLLFSPMVAVLVSGLFTNRINQILFAEILDGA